ncbi:F-box domain-containing protein [Artemisia annua]|uniref:F-box domain-containing protein n=1 Tax=Artemisia annua TaxID=35608 RepID=A0A2U1MDZ4_ARTAN|nr:F-box domain-containing protein [Artemisia annua]
MCCFNLTYMQGNLGFMFSVNESLAFTHLDTKPLQLQTLKPIASSEGVWCFTYGSNMMVVLWNPSIKISVGIFVPSFLNQPDSPKMVIGFGVRPDTLDPTILKINYPYYGQGPWYVSVYTLSTRRWENLENDHLPHETIRIKRSGQAVVGGKIFWVGSKKFVYNDGNSYKQYMIVSFDLVSHQFQVQDIPELIRFIVPPPFYISQLRNSLVMSGSFLAEEYRILCTWVLEFDGGIVSSCTVLFTIPFLIEHVVKLIGFTKDEEPIVESKSNQHSANSLQVYNKTSQQFQNIGIEANGGSFFIGP